jgi:hypothetical protein
MGKMELGGRMVKKKTYDVLVVGGGVAGVAAALEASRSGWKTAIIEKTILWGGMATSGLVPIYMPLCDGKGRQVTFGMAEEFLYASIKYGPGALPPVWAKKRSGKNEHFEYDELYQGSGMAKRFQTFFCPAAFAFSLDELLENSKVDLWLDTLACLPVMHGNKITGVEVENKSGRILVNARIIIDGSGDADIAFRAGAPCVERGSSPSMLYQYSSLKLAQQAVAKKSATRLVTWHGGGAANEMGKGYDGPKGIFTGTDGKGLSEFIMESRRVARCKMAKEQQEQGRQNVYPTALPSMHQIRMTRRIDGEDLVKDDMMNKFHPDSVGMIADCRQVEAVWEVPYGALLPKKVENLLVVGRCHAADEYVWHVTRLIQSAALTGQVAGIAAGLAIQKKTTPHNLVVGMIQKKAKNRGIVLHL